MRVTIRATGFGRVIPGLNRLTKNIPKAGEEIIKEVAEMIAKDSRRQLAPHMWRGNILMTRVFASKGERNNYVVNVRGEAVFFQTGVKPHPVVPAKHPVLKQWVTDHLPNFDPNRVITLPTNPAMAKPGMKFLDKAVARTVRKMPTISERVMDNAIRDSGFKGG